MDGYQVDDDASWVELFRWNVTRNGYLYRTHQGRTSYLHREIWEEANGPIPDGMEIDHINRDVTDNRLANLRLVTRTENNRNRKFRGSQV